MCQDDVEEKVKGQLARMNLIVKRIESELDQLKNLINLQIDEGLTASPSTNCDGNCDCDTSISIVDTYCLVDTVKIEDFDPISTTQDVSNYQEDFNEDQEQEVNSQNRPSNEDELILGGVDFNCEVPSKSKAKEDVTHVDPLQSLFITSFQNEDKVISQALVDVDPVDFNPDVVDSIQISNGNLDGLAGKNDQELLFFHMGVRCDKNPLILHSNRRREEIDRKKEKSQSKSSKINQQNGKRVIFSRPRPKGSMKKLFHNCSLCSKSFPKFSALSRHMKVHTGERPFKCKICSKSFSEKGNLKRHNLVHTGEKPFSCSVCEKSFAENSKLNRHKMMVHKDPLM